MGKIQIGDLSDLVLNHCPLGCDGDCARIWINEITNHKIICKCECKHKETLAEVWDPIANVTDGSSSSGETEENDS